MSSPYQQSVICRILYNIWYQLLISIIKTQERSHSLEWVFVSITFIIATYDAGSSTHRYCNNCKRTTAIVYFVLVYISIGLLSLFLFFPLSGVRRWPKLFTASSDRLFHPPLSPVFFFQSPSSPAFVTSLLTQSSHLSLGLPRLLLLTYSTKKKTNEY